MQAVQTQKDVLEGNEQTRVQVGGLVRALVLPGEQISMGLLI